MFQRHNIQTISNYAWLSTWLKPPLSFNIWKLNLGLWGPMPMPFHLNIGRPPFQNATGTTAEDRFFPAFFHQTPTSRMLQHRVTPHKTGPETSWRLSVTNRSTISKQTWNCWEVASWGVTCSRSWKHHDTPISSTGFQNLNAVWCQVVITRLYFVRWISTISIHLNLTLIWMSFEAWRLMDGPRNVQTSLGITSPVAAILIQCKNSL